MKKLSYFLSSFAALFALVLWLGTTGEAIRGGIIPNFPVICGIIVSGANIFLGMILSAK